MADKRKGIRIDIGKYTSEIIESDAITFQMDTKDLIITIVEKITRGIESKDFKRQVNLLLMVLQIADEIFQSYVNDEDLCAKYPFFSPSGCKISTSKNLGVGQNGKKDRTESIIPTNDTVFDVYDILNLIFVKDAKKIYNDYGIYKKISVNKLCVTVPCTCEDINTYYDDSFYEKLYGIGYENQKRSAKVNGFTKRDFLCIPNIYLDEFLESLIKSTKSNKTLEEVRQIIKEDSKEENVIGKFEEAYKKIRNKMYYDNYLEFVKFSFGISRVGETTLKFSDEQHLDVYLNLFEKELYAFGFQYERIQALGLYIRSVLEFYASLPLWRRERILYSEKFDAIEGYNDRIGIERNALTRGGKKSYTPSNSILNRDDTLQRVCPMIVPNSKNERNYLVSCTLDNEINSIPLYKFRGKDHDSIFVSNKIKQETDKQKGVLPFDKINAEITNALANQDVDSISGKIKQDSNDEKEQNSNGKTRNDKTKDIKFWSVTMSDSAWEEFQNNPLQRPKVTGIDTKDTSKHHVKLRGKEEDIRKYFNFILNDTKEFNIVEISKDEKLKVESTEEKRKKDNKEPKKIDFS